MPPAFRRFKGTSGLARNLSSEEPQRMKASILTDVVFTAKRYAQLTAA
jgi:hypothetical protein